MATGYAWLLNLDAERELAEPANYRPSPEIEARISGLCARMELLLGADDKLIGCHDPAELSACARVFAFCPTPSALQRMRAAGFEPPPAPPLEVLRRVNSRAFCAELGQPLSGAYVRSIAELSAVLASRGEQSEWLLKRDFGFAGRERRRASARGLDAPTLGFARNSFARGQGLQVEPLVARSHDFAQHGYILRDGQLLLGAPHAQDCDARGVWQASRALAAQELEAEEAAQLEASCREAGEALVAAGYFGPYGVDAYRFYDPSMGRSFQPRSEINARFSMGYPRALLEAAIARDEDDAHT